jgi:hypothetical protein
MNVDTKTLSEIEARLDAPSLAFLEAAADRMVAVKEQGGKVAVVTGSGPNVHEGVTTLIAELMRVGIVDGVSTSSAVVAHEMGGTLDEVKRCPGIPLGVPEYLLPRGGEFELTCMDADMLGRIETVMPLDRELIRKLEEAKGKTIIKAAGNLGYPMGLWLEWLSNEIGMLARSEGMSFEETAGLGADPRTMMGAGAKKGLPVIVTIPQLVGGGAVGLNIGDTISLRERASRLARMLDSSDVIIESAVALTQEIHDGPLERYTGHGLWSAWMGHYTYSLEGKTLVRIDLDPALAQVCEAEKGSGEVQRAIAEGLPKTKLFKVPFRMEMSGFARHEGSIPIIGDIGVVWPLLAFRVASRLGIDLNFISYPQDTDAGKEMRQWIVREVRPLDRDRLLGKLSERVRQRP